ncbi:MAG: leucyl aminopeptidase [Acidobacteria bacterium]|nr:leucyl aminopeptidase [Acidobacteriota bacterium]
MKIELQQESVVKLLTPALAVYSFEENPASTGTASRLPAEVQKILGELKSGGEITGKAYECTLIHHPAGMAAHKLLLVGAGKREKFKPFQLGRLAGTAVRYLRARGVHQMAWFIQEEDGAEEIQSVVDGAILADYDADRYRTEREAERRIDLFTLVCDKPAAPEAWTAAIEEGQKIAEATNFTRNLVNEPANQMTPTLLARRAREMATSAGLAYQELGPEEIRSLKMGAFWAVAQGSEEPPRMLILRYMPPDASESPVIGLIGKGITFDSGGISIKPSQDMHEMKTDMAGGATMLGVMQAIAQLKPRVRVIAVVPATENMPSGKAYRPGDVITSMSGKTIEVLNTDAEGRLVLADALAYAKRLGCNVLIDVATLTGAVMVALGNITTGVFGRDQEWVNRVLASGAETGEKMWQMPVDDDYRELYKSSIADLANTGGRYGGAITAAMFVGEFAGDTPWVHLDIAGTRWSNEEKPYLAKGPTGVPVRTLVHLLLHVAQLK